VNGLAFALHLFSGVCMWKFVIPCVNDAAEAEKAQDQAAARDYMVMATVGFLAYAFVFVFV
jgi:ABC-type polysaccharide/polyol phosphate export permease